MLVALIPRQADRLDAHLMAGQDRDAVVGLLSDDREIVAEILDLDPRKAVARNFQFLQQYDIGLAGAQPRREMGNPTPDGIDVPGRDANHRLLRRSDGEGSAAAAGGGGVGVADLEGSADKIFDEIDLGAGQEIERSSVHEELDPVALKFRIVLVTRIVEGKPILKAGAAAADDGETQHQLRIAFGRSQHGNAPCRRLRQAYLLHWADFVHLRVALGALYQPYTKLECKDEARFVKPQASRYCPADVGPCPLCQPAGAEPRPSQARAGAPDALRLSARSRSNPSFHGLSPPEAQDPALRLSPV